MKMTMKTESKFKNFRLRGDVIAETVRVPLPGRIVRLTCVLALIALTFAAIWNFAPVIFFACLDSLIAAAMTNGDADFAKIVMVMPAAFVTIGISVALLFFCDELCSALNNWFARRQVSAPSASGPVAAAANSVQAVTAPVDPNNASDSDEDQLSRRLALQTIQEWGGQVTIYPSLDIERPETLRSIELLRKALLNAYKLGANKQAAYGNDALHSH